MLCRGKALTDLCKVLVYKVCIRQYTTDAHFQNFQCITVGCRVLITHPYHNNNDVDA